MNRRVYLEDKSVIAERLERWMGFCYVKDKYECAVRDRLVTSNMVDIGTLS